MSNAAVGAITSALSVAQLITNTVQRARAIRDAEQDAQLALKRAKEQVAQLNDLMLFRAAARQEEATQVIAAQRAIIAQRGIVGGSLATTAASRTVRNMLAEIEADAIQTRARVQQIMWDAEGKAVQVERLRERAIFETISEAAGVSAGILRDIDIEKGKSAARTTLKDNSNYGA